MPDKRNGFLTLILFFASHIITFFMNYHTFYYKLGFPSPYYIVPVNLKIPNWGSEPTFNPIYLAVDIIFSYLVALFILFLFSKIKLIKK